MIETWFPGNIQIEAARKFAMVHHRGQMRRGGREPYWNHVAEVHEILRDCGAGPEVRQAGYLHDVVEDQSVSLEQIRMFFGRQVAGYVQEVTEEDRTRPWVVRKANAIARISYMMYGSALIKSADATSNMRSLQRGLATQGVRYFTYFHATPDEQIRRFEALTDALLKRVSRSPIGEHLQQAHNDLMNVARPLVQRNT